MFKVAAGDPLLLTKWSACLYQLYRWPGVQYHFHSISIDFLRFSSIFYGCHSISIDFLRLSAISTAFPSIFYDFHSISIDFLRFSSIFGVQKSPGSVGEFRGVWGRPDPKKLTKKVCNSYRVVWAPNLAYR